MLWIKTLFPLLAALSGLLFAYSYFVTESHSMTFISLMALAVSIMATLAGLNLNPPSAEGDMEDMEAIRRAFKKEMKSIEKDMVAEAESKHHVSDTASDRSKRIQR
jgi:hypothetical protein